jgi:L-seryl-tRNA(Ser) seleniumtransferase
MVLAALQTTLLAYLRRDGMAVPFWRMATTPVEDLRARARAVAASAAAAGADVRVVDCTAVAGGGSSPGLGIPSAGVAVDGDHREALRHGDPPVVARVEDGRTVCDLRAVDPSLDAPLARALAAAVAAGGGRGRLAGAPAGAADWEHGRAPDGRGR